MQRRRIAILHHVKDKRNKVKKYAIGWLAKFWEDDGHVVIHLFGTNRQVPADLLILHIDLSVVPDDYIVFAQMYPIALNINVKDIRKRTFSHHLLDPEDPWDGPVIIKSNLNHAGLPEIKRKLIGSDAGLHHSFGSPLDYPVYRHLRDVPSEYFFNPDVVVQKFLPEYQNGLFHVRLYQFLGDAYTCNRISSRYPIVRVESRITSVPVKLHPEVEELRHRMGFDYGKIDYVVTDNGVFILDLNKTVGAGGLDDPATRELRRIRAMGLYSYFDNSSP